MIDPPPIETTPPEGIPALEIAPARLPRRWGLRVGLREMVLLLAAVAVWLGDWVNRRHNEDLRARIAVLQPIARELIIDDPAKAAAVKLQELWYDENRWDLYLPDGEYRLLLATGEIDPNKGIPAPSRTVPIRGGRHILALEQKKERDAWRVIVTLDGAVAIEEQRPASWDAGRGSQGGSTLTASKTFPIDEPIVVFRRVFMQETKPGIFASRSGPGNGVMLWIEREPRSP